MSPDFDRQKLIHSVLLIIGIILVIGLLAIWHRESSMTLSEYAARNSQTSSSESIQNGETAGNTSP